MANPYQMERNFFPASTRRGCCAILHRRRSKEQSGACGENASGTPPLAGHRQEKQKSVHLLDADVLLQFLFRRRRSALVSTSFFSFRPSALTSVRDIYRYAASRARYIASSVIRRALATLSAPYTEHFAAKCAATAVNALDIASVCNCVCKCMQNCKCMQWKSPAIPVAVKCIFCQIK